MARKITELETRLESVADRNKLIFSKPKVFAKPSYALNICETITHNRFLTLQEELAEADNQILIEADVHLNDSFTPSKCTKKSTVPSKPSKISYEGRVMILSDSHGKDLYQHLRDLDQIFDVMVLAKPGAPLKQVVKEGLPLIQDFTLKDCVILLAGTNDIGEKKLGQKTINEGINQLLSSDITTNIVITEIPYRYDTPEINDEIYWVNSGLMRTVQYYNGKKQLSFCKINELLARSHYTKHGLHCNRHGKGVIGTAFTNFVKVAINRTKNTTTKFFAKHQSLPTNTNTKPVARRLCLDTSDMYAITVWRDDAVATGVSGQSGDSGKGECSPSPSPSPDETPDSPRSWASLLYQSERSDAAASPPLRPLLHDDQTSRPPPAVDLRDFPPLHSAPSSPINVSISPSLNRYFLSINQDSSPTT